MRGEPAQDIAAHAVFGRICPVFGVAAFGVEIFYRADALGGDFRVVKRLVALYAVLRLMRLSATDFASLPMLVTNPRPVMATFFLLMSGFIVEC